MKSIHRKPIRNFRDSWILSTASLLLLNLSLLFQAQAQNQNWIELELTDTMEYAAFGGGSPVATNYPPSHLFDADLSTCWVANKEQPEIFIQSPSFPAVLNIYAGYGKSKSLFYKNSRPTKLKFSIYYGINPEGYVSEYAALYKTLRCPVEQIVTLTDSPVIQHIPLNYNADSLVLYQKAIEKRYSEDFGMPASESRTIIQVEILETSKGTKWDDICISEIFFNDRFISTESTGYLPTEEVSINEDENTLLLKTPDKEEVIYSDSSAVLQLVEVSKNKRWAILIAMPAEIQGRMETTYLLTDLAGKKIVNQQLQKTTGDYLPGNEMYFDYDEQGDLFLLYVNKKMEKKKIRLGR